MNECEKTNTKEVTCCDLGSLRNMSKLCETICTETVIYYADVITRHSRRQQRKRSSSDGVNTPKLNLIETRHNFMFSILVLLWIFFQILEFEELPISCTYHIHAA